MHLYGKFCFACRWDGSGVAQLSDYIRASYATLQKFNKEVGEDLVKKQRTYAFNKYIQEVWDHVLNLIDYMLMYRLSYRLLLAGPK